MSILIFLKVSKGAIPEINRYIISHPNHIHYFWVSKGLLRYDHFRIHNVPLFAPSVAVLTIYKYDSDGQI